MSKGLPDREEELDMTDALDSFGCAAEQELLIGPLQTVKRRWIDAVGEIDADGTERRAIAESETGGVHHVIEIGEVILTGSKRDAAQSGIDIAQVMEEYSL